jgi:hyperosmotically inducible protein
MKLTVRRTIAFLGATWMATQLFINIPANAAPFRSTSGAFEQAMPVTPAQKDVERLFKQISANAVLAGKHADRLDSYTRAGSRLHPTTHGSELTGAKEAINAIGADLRRLQELRPGALPWQQSVIDRIEPAAIALAGHATDAIQRLNEDRGPLTSQEYREAIGNLNANAGQIRTLISVNLDYAQSREKLNRMDATLSEPVVNASPESASAGISSKPSKTLEQRVRTELVKLPYYGVFDHLAFQMEGDQVVLIGEVSWPALKTDAQRAVSRIEGVSAVTNDIKVLPLSPNDDGLRMATYWAIYGQPTLARYRLNPNPPIRIIVENGHVTLKGVVGSEMDRTIANMQAHSVPGAFSVTNHLQIGS